jgi:FAD/FMN-containing dehydrogenase
MPIVAIRTIVESLPLSTSKAEAGLSLGYAVDPAVLAAAHARVDAAEAAMREHGRVYWVDSMAHEAACLGGCAC